MRLPVARKSGPAVAGAGVAGAGVGALALAVVVAGDGAFSCRRLRSEQGVKKLAKTVCWSWR